MTKSQAELLKKALEEAFQGHAEFESVNGNGRYRFAITANQFEAMPHLKRQDEAWKVVDRVLPPEAAVDISILLAYAPADLTPSQ